MAINRKRDKIRLSSDKAYLARKEFVENTLRNSRVLKRGGVTFEEFLEIAFPNFVGDLPISIDELENTIERMAAEGDITITKR